MPPPLPLDAVFIGPVGYAAGRARRTQILHDAADLFAANGYHGTTMRDLAERVGVSPSTLLHHFHDKAELLAEVLRFRDLGMARRRGGDEVPGAIEDLNQLGQEARRDEIVEPGLISLQAVLSTEAIAASHPAHGYFVERFERTLAYFENLFARAAVDLGVSLDPKLEATWLVAMWDGLQFRHLLSSTPVDIAIYLEAHVARVLQR